MSRLIDADALWMDVIHSMDYCDDILEFIERQPTIEPERKKGKWILVNGRTAINCSVCWRCSWSLSFEDTVRQFNFCPNCGADMKRGGQDD